MRAVLMLHSIDSSGSAISLAPEEFAGLVRGVLQSGHAIVPLRELLAKPMANAVALTFDDGFASLATLAAPVLSEHGISATVFLTTGHIGRDNHWPSQPPSAPRLAMLDWPGVESLHAAGWEIEAHSHSHPDLRGLSADELAEELESPQREIERRLGHTPRAFAYPYGLLDARVVEAVAARYDLAVTTRMAGLDGEPSVPLRVPRLDAYYLRHPALQARFSGASALGGFGGGAFRAWVGFRAALRRWRGHPGEST